MSNNTTEKTSFATKLKNFFTPHASLTEKKSRVGWIFVAPFVIGLVFIYASAVWESLCYSVADYRQLSALEGFGYQLQWVGLANYKAALNLTVDAEQGILFKEFLFTSFFDQVVEIVAIILLSLFVAVLLNQKMVGRAAFRAIFFIPVVIGAGIIAKIDNGNAIITSMSSLEGLDMGMVDGGTSFISAMDLTAAFQNLGIASKFVDVVVQLVNDIYNIVNRSGVQMLIFLSGLQSISPSIYESCQMEGATSWETFWKITFPMISPMILANSVYTVIDSFTAESNKVMSFILNKSGGSMTSVDTVQSAACWIYFALVILMLAIVFGICRTFVFYQRRND